MTGAGAGVMEAANSGAGPEHSIGLNVDLPFEQHPNPFVSGHSCRLLYFRDFLTRKLFFLRESDAVVVMPGIPSGASPL
jgi:predicted Rossmann-fold nucleotide-binding protein